MRDEDALALARRASPSFADAGLCEKSAVPPKVASANARSIASLWGGMGSIEQITATTEEHGKIVFVAKVIKLPKGRLSVGDQRKADSYDVEAAFYGNHATKLIAAGCTVPCPIAVDRGPPLVICMSLLEGHDNFRMDKKMSAAALNWLARLHALYWGAKADAAVSSGLQKQGCYWYLDTRFEEHERMPNKGWEGRLRLAARALDARLKADPLQSIVHGDAKEANMIITKDGSIGFVDFQYCGKACVAKDLAYCLCCASDTPEEEASLLKGYHQDLSQLLIAQGDTPPELNKLEDALELAYADLGRWMSGWGWWGHAGMLRERIVKLLDKLDGGSALKGGEAEYKEAVMRAFPL